MAVFDAFKYAETPLRRHFISQLARELRIPGREFRKGLYADSTDTDVEIPRAKALKLVGVFGAVVLLGAALAALLALATAAIADGETWKNFVRFVAVALPLGALPASILGAFITLAGTTFTVRRSVSAPSGEEEFEHLFRKLVKKAKANRLIIFIDELDRCSSEDVVSTLETVRTFLDVHGCVFIVAADQQVLEQALRNKLKQATPADARDPYYSTGSEYLDKTFQHHVQLPPLLPRRLTRFALQSVASHGGIWKVLDLDEVMPVLIPTHVRSPRQIKVLLNHFVATFRLAERRAYEGTLDVDVKTRALEVAKLVALRCEFPLFARDLAVDARLPEYVLAEMRGPGGLPQHVSDDVRRLAHLYSRGALPVDQLLISEPVEPTEGSRDERLDHGDDVHARVRSAQAAQLLAFLEKTEYVDGPRRDLIHLESTGPMFGLDSTFADRLEEHAVNGQRSVVVDTLRELENDEERLAALRLLAQVTRDSDLHVGIEARNCMSALLSAVSQLADLDLAPVAGELAQAVAAHMRRYELTSADLPGAFLLALRTPLGGGGAIIENILSQDGELESNEQLADTVLEQAERLLPEHEERLAHLVAVKLLDGAEIHSHLISLPSDALTALLQTVEDALMPMLRHESITDGEEPVERRDPGPAAEALAGLLAELIGDQRRGPAYATARLLFALDESDASDVVWTHLSELAPIDDRRLAADVARAAWQGETQFWATWLAGLDTNVYADAAVQGWLKQLSARLWARVVAGEITSDSHVLEEAVDALGRYARRSDWTDAEVENAMEPLVAVAASDSEAARAQDEMLTLANRFASAGIASLAVLAPQVVSRFVTTLETPLPSIGPDDPVVRTLLRWVPPFASLVTLDARVDLARAAAAASWLPTPDRETLVLEVAAVQVARDGLTEAPITGEQLAALVEAHGPAADGALAVWLEAFGKRPREVVAALQPRADQEPGSKLADALITYTALDPDGAAEVSLALISRLKQAVPSVKLMRLLRGSAQDDEALAHTLTDAYEGADNNQRREDVLRIWKALPPSSDAARKRLIREVLLPCALGTKYGLEIALRYLPLADPAPHGTRGEIRRQLRQAARDREQRRRVEAGLVSIGLVKKGFLGRSQDVG